MLLGLDHLTLLHPSTVFRIYYYGSVVQGGVCLDLAGLIMRSIKVDWFDMCNYPMHTYPSFLLCFVRFSSWTISGTKEVHVSYLLTRQPGVNEAVSLAIFRVQYYSQKYFFSVQLVFILCSIVCSGNTSEVCVTDSWECTTPVKHIQNLLLLSKSVEVLADYQIGRWLAYLANDSE